MATNQEPIFPAIWLGETCGLMHFPDQDRLFTTQLMLWGPLTLDGDSIVCSNGIEWSISVSQKERFSLRNWLKVLVGREVKVRVEYAYSKSGEFGLEELKARLIKQSANDPGDLMWQFVEHEDIVKGVTSAKSFSELFDFLLHTVCEES